jgi:tetratricopeptide (TPR) repeat protein
MRYILFILFFICFFSSCSVYRNNQNIVDNQDNDYFEVEIKLREEEQRKFNYYFLEANRFKAINEINKSFLYYIEALKIDTTCAVCAFEVAQVLLAEENIEEAEKLMEKAVRYSPRNRYYVILLSRIYQNNDKGNEAVKVAESLLDFSDPPSVNDLYFVAQLQLENGMYDRAISSLRSIEAQIGINDALSLEIYQLFLKKNDFKSAQKELEKLIEEYPSSGDYRVYLGDFFLQNNDFKRALEEYKRVLKIQPDNGKVHFSLANYYLNVGDTVAFKEEMLNGLSSANVGFEDKFRRFYPFVSQFNSQNNPLNEEDIIKFYEVLVKIHPYQPDIYRSYGSFLVDRGEYEEALNVYKKGVDMDASWQDIWQEYLILLSQVGNYEELVSKSSTAISIYPSEPLFRLFHGVGLFQLGEFTKSAKSLEMGLDLVTGNIRLKEQFHAYLGDIYHSLGNVDKSFYHYEEALKIDENNIIVLNNYSYYLALEGRDLDRAERMSAKTVELEPANATYLDTYAWVLFKKGRYTEAKFIMERAIDNLKEDNGIYYEHYGDILYKTGDIEGALRQWNKAMEYEDHSELLEEKIKRKTYIDGE